MKYAANISHINTHLNSKIPVNCSSYCRCNNEWCRYNNSVVL